MIYIVSAIQSRKCPSTTYELPWEDLRPVGYFLTFDNAKKCILENWGDIHEDCYDYALIEGLPEGLYQDSNKYWYQWKNEKYVEIDSPPWAEHRFSSYVVG